MSVNEEAISVHRSVCIITTIGVVVNAAAAMVSIAKSETGFAVFVGCGLVCLMLAVGNAYAWGRRGYMQYVYEREHEEMLRQERRQEA